MARVSSNAAVVAAQLETRAVAVPAAATAVVRHHAMILETAIRAAASGRPGPEVQSGNYRRSWGTEVRTVPGGVEAMVGTAGLERLRWLRMRREALGNLTNAVGALIEAWDAVGEKAAATALEETAEHYMNLYLAADRDVERANAAALAAT